MDDYSSELKAYAGTTVGEALAREPSLGDKLAPHLELARKIWLGPLLRRVPRALREKVKRAVEAAALETESLREAVQQALHDDADDAIVEQRLELVQQSGLLEDPLGLRQKIKEHPCLAPALERAALEDLARVAGVPKERMGRLADAGIIADALSDAELQRAVDGQLLSSREAGALGLAFNLIELAGDRNAAESLLATELPTTGSPLRHVRQLAELSKAQAEVVAKASKLELAEVDRVITTARALFPIDAAVARLPDANLAMLSADLQEIGELFERSSHPVSDPSLVIEGEQRAAVDRLRRLGAGYPGLALYDLMHERQRDAGETAQRVAQRVEAFKKALRFDAALDSLEPGANEAELPLFRAQRRTVQGLVNLGLEADEVSLTLQGGWHEYLAIARASLPSLERSGLPSELADKLQRAARTALRGILPKAATLIDLIGSQKLLPFKGGNNISNVFESELRQSQALDEILGPLDYCHCDPCRSLLSPAAYFVDLMQFVEQHVLEPAFDDQGHPGHLRTRRPDLYLLSLNCDSVRTELPTLSIVNDLLERYLVGDDDSPGICGGGEVALREGVYRDLLATALDASGSIRGSVTAPFLLSLAETDVLLGELGQDRWYLTRLFSSPSEHQQAALLGTSLVELELLRNAVPAENVFGTTASDLAARPPESRWLASVLKLDVEELRAVLATRVVRGDETPALRIERVGSPQPTREEVAGLSTRTLDRLHRFVRLLRRVPWSAAELDALFRQWAETHATPPVDWSTVLTDALDDVFGSLAIARERSLSFDDVLAMSGPLPLEARSDESPSLFSRRFEEGSTLLPSSDVFVHPSFSGSATGGDLAAAMASALGVDQETLIALIERLAPVLSSSGDVAAGFIPDPAHLSILYRHARLASQGPSGVTNLFNQLELLGLQAVTGIADLRTLFDHDALRRRHPHDWLDYVTSLEPDPEASGTAESVVARTRREQAYYFSATVLALVEGVSEAQSITIVQGSSAFVREAGGERYRLADTVDLAIPLALPPGILLEPAVEAMIREQLAAYRLVEVLAVAVAAQLSISRERLSALLSLLGRSLAEAAVQREVLEPIPPSVLGQLLTSLSRLAQLTQALSEDLVVWLGEHPEVVGFGGGSTLDLVARIDKLLVHWERSRDDLAGLQAVLEGYSAATRFASVPDEALVSVASAEATFVRAVSELNPSEPVPVDALDRLLRSIEAVRALGVTPESLSVLSSAVVGGANEYDGWTQLANALLAAHRAAHPADADADARVADPLRSRRRDALRDHLLANEPERFSSNVDIFDYFLIDSEMQGCARTSCVIAATSALQTYVQRILLGLEQWDDARVAPSLIPEAEWSWRRQYRLWEANRKIFLNPENYLALVPRDNRTQLFKEFEDRLLAGELTEQTVLDAFAGYVRGLDELGRMRLVGSYLEKDYWHGTDVLHLFGTTSQDPPQLMYRRVENLHQSQLEGAPRGVRFLPWEPVDVSVPDSVVSPVVHQGRLYLFWVEQRTSPETRFVNGTSQFEGYKHEISWHFTTMRLDGTWTSPQTIDLSDRRFFPDGPGVVLDPLVQWKLRTQRVAELDTVQVPIVYSTITGLEPVDGYHLRDFRFDRVFPESDVGSLRLSGLNFEVDGVSADLFRRRFGVSHGIGDVWVPRCLSVASDGRGINTVRAGYNHYYNVDFSELGWATVWSSSERFGVWGRHRERLGQATNVSVGYSTRTESGVLLRFHSPVVLEPVGGMIADCLAHVGSDVLYLQGGHAYGGEYVVRRLGSTVTERLAQTLFVGGVDALLATENQEALHEAEAPLTLGSRALPIADLVISDGLDFEGPYGEYYRELFFHAPFAIACHLHAVGKFEEARKWMHYLYNPTVDDVDGVDRPFRYIEFRDLDPETLRAKLSDESALAAYRADPFNPHAIARLRLTAYQRAVVMKYLDILLDQGDELFTRFTRKA